MTHGNAGETIVVSEVYGPVIQGEGAVIGRPTVFVRTGGCDYRCGWCDSKFAVLPEYRHEWSRMDAEEVFAEVKRLSPTPIMVTLSGGNPALQPMENLIRLGKREGFTFAIETQGSVPKGWFSALDELTLSPKPPSSGMKTNREILEKCVGAAGEDTKISMKVVVFDDADYEFAKEIGGRFPDITTYLQVGNEYMPEEDEIPDPSVLLGRYEWLSGKVLADGWNDAVVLPQLHVLIYGNRRGV